MEVERYANSIEVKGYDRTGQCVEMYLDPRTGDLLRRERDDSCGRSEGSEGRDSDDSDDHHRHHGGR